MPIKTHINTDIELKPQGSQTVLVVSTMLAGICLLSGFYFLWKDKGSAWVPLLIGVGIFGSVILSWFKSQKDIDLKRTSPTTLQNNDGVLVQIDTRALMAPEGIQLLEKIMTIFANREPLPEPDGIIDSKGTPVPNSQNIAKGIVDRANEEAKNLTEVAAKNFGIEVEPTIYTTKSCKGIKIEFDKDETLNAIKVNKIEELENG